MDTNEFSEAFDLERFKAGEYALTRFNQLVEYHSIVDDRFYVTRPSDNCPAWCFVEDLPSWRMKPAVSAETQWIPHDGGGCPIPWAQEGEFEAESNSMIYRNDLPALRISWSGVRRYRLVNGWLPVLDGKCPFPEGARIDFRLGSGEIIRNVRANPSGDAWADCIVAARRIKPAEKPVPQIFCSEAQDPTNWNTKGFKLADIIAAHSLPTATKIYRDYFIDVEPLHDYRPREQKSPGDCLKRIRAQYHTPVYVGIDWSKDVAAYHRFRSSPRGKEALAKIGKATGQQFKPLGEDAMLNLFSSALTEFEAEIERKRK